MCGPEIDEGEVPEDNEFESVDRIRPNAVIISRLAYNPRSATIYIDAMKIGSFAW